MFLIVPASLALSNNDPSFTSLTEAITFLSTVLSRGWLRCAVGARMRRWEVIGRVSKVKSFCPPAIVLYLPKVTVCHGVCEASYHWPYIVPCCSGGCGGMTGDGGQWSPLFLLSWLERFQVFLDRVVLINLMTCRNRLASQ